MTRISGLRQRFLGLCLPPLLFCALDATLTLVGQCHEYWQGQWQYVNEATPTLHYLLTIHPAAFIAGMAAWAVIFVALVLLLPDTLALILSVGVVLGHVMGAATWVYYHFRLGYQLCDGLLLLAATSIAVGVRWGWQAGPKEPIGYGRMRGALRWSLIGVLVAMGVLLSGIWHCAGAK